jgi:hypothetical protein
MKYYKTCARLLEEEHKRLFNKEIEEIKEKT